MTFVAALIILLAVVSAGEDITKAIRELTEAVKKLEKRK